MSCQQTQEWLNDYCDGELAPQESVAIRTHLSECQECFQHFEELNKLKAVLATAIPLPAASQRRILSRIENRSRRGWVAPIGDWMDAVSTYWRDLDKNIVRARLGAVPLSLMFFLVIAGQFPVRGMQEWTYSVFKGSVAQQKGTRPVMVQVLQPTREINELVETAWRIPYEDSLSVVVDIDAFGGASIGDVLEYPKNFELLEKVGRTLQEARFDFDQKNADSFIIYSFQKIDVYEGRGL